MLNLPLADFTGEAIVCGNCPAAIALIAGPFATETGRIGAAGGTCFANA